MNFVTKDMPSTELESSKTGLTGYSSMWGVVKTASGYSYTCTA